MKSMTPRGTGCPLDHLVSGLTGRRWTGANIRARVDGAVWFGDLSWAVHRVSDRIRSECQIDQEA